MLKLSASSMLALAAIAVVAPSTLAACPDFSLGEAGWEQQLKFNGDAKANGDFLRVVPATLGAATGSAFLKQTCMLDENSSFETHFTFKMENPADPGTGTDGFAFVMHSDPRGAKAIGGEGGNLGYGGNPAGSMLPIRITPSVAIEFDIYKNPEDANGKHPGSNNDNHVGININGELESEFAVNPEVNLKSGKLIDAWIAYDGVADLLSVSLREEGSNLVNFLPSFSLNLFATLGPEFYVGFTGSQVGVPTNIDIVAWGDSKTVPEPAAIVGLGVVAAALQLVKTRKRA